MNVRLFPMLALSLALPLASCRFVGTRPDFSVLADSFRPAETDTVYVENKPAAATPLASYSMPSPPAAPPVAAPPPAAPAASNTPAPSFLESLLEAIFPGSTQPTAPIATTPASGTPPRNGFYTVRPGDTLSRIARIHNVPLSSLASSNGIDLQAPLIRPGQMLRIPGGTAAIVPPHQGIATAPALPVSRPATTPTAPVPAPAAPVASIPRPASPPVPAGQYRVCAGDTAYRIAQKHRISLPALLQANNLDDASARSLRVGTLLTIPTQQRR